MRTSVLAVVGTVALAGSQMGCWHRYQVYNIDWSRQGPATLQGCETRIARIRELGWFDHALARDCYISVLPPFYFCGPLFGFESSLVIERKATGPLVARIDEYEFRYGIPTRIVEPSGLDHRPGDPVLVVAIEDPVQPFSWSRAVRFCAAGGIADASIHVAGEFQIGEEVERFACDIPLQYRSYGFWFAGTE